MVKCGRGYLKIRAVDGEEVGRQRRDAVVPQDQLLETVRLQDGEELAREAGEMIVAQINQLEVDAGSGPHVTGQQGTQVVAG